MENETADHVFMFRSLQRKQRISQLWGKVLFNYEPLLVLSRLSPPFTCPFVACARPIVVCSGFHCQPWTCNESLVNLLMNLVFLHSPSLVLFFFFLQVASGLVGGHSVFVFTYFSCSSIYTCHKISNLHRRFHIVMFDVIR